MRVTFVTSAIVALSISAVGVRAQTTTLTMSSWVPPSHGMTKEMLPQFAADVEKATKGRVKLQMLAKHPSSPPGTFDAVKDGLVDVSFTSASYNPQRFVLTLLAEMPGGGANAEINSVAFGRIHARHFEKAGEFKGVKLLGVFTHGPGQIYNTKRAVTKLEDLSAMKIRTGGGVADELGRALGAATFVKPAPESYELLSSGIADGMFGPLEAIQSFKLGGVIKHLTLFPGGFYSTTLALFMNEDKFNKLPKEDQDAINALSGEHVSRLAGKVWDRYDAAALEEVRKTPVVVSDASPELVKSVEERAKDIAAKWIAAANAKGVDGAKALAEFKEEIKNVAAGK